MAYYVYELIDPRDGLPFYVGKGRGQRVAVHEKEAAEGKQSAKCERIRDIWKAGLDVERNIVRRFRFDIDAYAFEAERIATIGRENLTNCRDGGIGGRVRFGRSVLLEEAAAILLGLREWRRRGSLSVVRFCIAGRTETLDLDGIVDGWTERLAHIAAKTSQSDVENLADRVGVKLTFS